MIMIKCCGVHALRIAVGITMLVLLLAGSANAANLAPADALTLNPTI